MPVYQFRHFPMRIGLAGWANVSLALPPFYGTPSKVSTAYEPSAVSRQLSASVSLPAAWPPCEQAQRTIRACVHLLADTTRPDGAARLARQRLMADRRWLTAICATR